MLYQNGGIVLGPQNRVICERFIILCTSLFGRVHYQRSPVPSVFLDAVCVCLS